MNIAIVPVWLWFLIGLGIVVYIGLAYANRREKSRRQAFERSKRIENTAKYRAWQWLFGRTKPLRLSDQSASKPPKP